MSVRVPRTRRRRLLAGVVVVLVALGALTACEDGEGVRDEGPSTVHSMRAASVAQ
ncbi:hypothetical protein [Streptomyces geranii]|uniref:hypothetical protein n=1 Tax=Streptomyces geranii TaxID=2058923 RepID=UPI0018E50C0B|nr:hypothetical protein [Streptomyces geranii]